MLTVVEDCLENEHLGNMDQYWATREVPLAYHMIQNVPTRTHIIATRPFSIHDVHNIIESNHYLCLTCIYFVPVRI
jgi:hypothetical protein